MIFHSSTWIPVAFGAATGALLGFYDDARQSDAAPRVARDTTVTVQAQSFAQRARDPVVRQDRSAAPRTVTVAREKTVVEAAPVESAKPRPSTPMVEDSAKRQPKVVRVKTSAKLSQAGTVHGGRQSARPDDPSGTEELSDARAVFRAESGCARQDPEECLRAARAFRVGIAIPPNPKSASIYLHSALRLYEEGCKRRDPLSCVGLATMYEHGPGQQPTYAPGVLDWARGICRDRKQSGCDEIDTEADKLRTLLQVPNTSGATRTE